MPIAVVEVLAAAFGLIGTLLLATKGRYAGWGFAAYLVSNAGWIMFALALRHWPLFWQQVGFTASSLFGLWVWVVKPWLQELETPFYSEIE